jgi:hypothetical protein
MFTAFIQLKNKTFAFPGYKRIFRIPTGIRKSSESPLIARFYQTESGALVVAERVEGIGGKSV